MQRLVQLLFCSCLLWALLLTAVQAAEEDEDYGLEGTPMPDYDYNSSFPFTFSFFSNVSNVYDDINKYFTGKDDDGDEKDEMEGETRESPRGKAYSDNRAALLSLLLPMGILGHQLFGPI
ncbi:uncharacterized protein si:ch211-191i18.2 [Brienomyrus brachyistius]|uniref:uncharacterized protein si:ch211-191i18.2 n=1 Tax=Brienomyrus brachyistius TaxID=42636 RepID=UPI0020B266D1|nr:uncharacterized protein si:ch211-191i18.2 [Brienomyrus brachyistius]XP_048850367.1 uncharacterized protein si:ch211-191i18.2 [Brienomyrus brachyistius]